MRCTLSRRYNPHMQPLPSSSSCRQLLFLGAVLLLAGTFWNVLLRTPVPWLPVALTLVNAALGWWAWARNQRQVMHGALGVAILGLLALWLGPAMTWGAVAWH